MNHDETPINRRSARSRRIRNAAEDVSLAVEEHLIWRGGDALKSVFEVVRRPFDRLLWALQRGVIWPLQDRAITLSPAARALSGAAVLILAVAAVAAGAALAGSDGSDQPAAAATTAQVTEAPAPDPAAPAARSAAPEPTLHGAAPVFKPARSNGDGSEVNAAEPLASPPAQQATDSSSSTSAATGRISSVPGNSSSAAAASLSAVEGRPAGPEAIAVAHKFAAAFVLYETGGDKTKVHETFATTATPELSKALLRRPPRLPQNGKVPKAKVVNVVAGPSRGGIYSVSVSLLRVGVTSELRLSMEKLKQDGWQVTNVLG